MDNDAPTDKNTPTAPVGSQLSHVTCGAISQTADRVGLLHRGAWWVKVRNVDTGSVLRMSPVIHRVAGSSSERIAVHTNLPQWRPPG
ncbi:hypothetical protein H4K36_01240 [Streptomyces sp. DHE7-1]|nr:hypothetical protein [Streptomyces sp. DHE7-1]